MYEEADLKKGSPEFDEDYSCVGTHCGFGVYSIGETEEKINRNQVVYNIDQRLSLHFNSC